MDEFISTKELIEIRKQEMASMRPNLYAEIKVKEKTVRIESPKPLDREQYKTKE